MGFNVTRLKQTGRGWGRGDPPPRGSIEYVAVGDMFEPETLSSSGFQVFEVSFTELDAADRWIKRLYENIRYTRKLHGDKILSAADVAEWDAFIPRWDALRKKLISLSTSYLGMMSKENKAQFDSLLNESRRMHNRFASKGMPMVPVPYMGELVLLLRKMPRQLTAAQMRVKLEAGVACGDHMLDENTTWWQWRRRDDTRGLAAAIANARRASEIYGRAKKAKETYQPGSPAYDEFMRRLSKIWIESAGLYGIVETKITAAAEAMDEARKTGEKAGDSLFWLLALAGAGYLGLRWLMKPKPVEITMRVPDAISREEPPNY